MGQNQSWCRELHTAVECKWKPGVITPLDDYNYGWQDSPEQNRGQLQTRSAMGTTIFKDTNTVTLLFDNDSGHTDSCIGIFVIPKPLKPIPSRHQYPLHQPSLKILAEHRQTRSILTSANPARCHMYYHHRQACEPYSMKIAIGVRSSKYTYHFAIYRL